MVEKERCSFRKNGLFSRRERSYAAALHELGLAHIMGAGASVPELPADKDKFTEEEAKALLGEEFEQPLFDQHKSEDGTLSKEKMQEMIDEYKEDEDDYVDDMPDPLNKDGERAPAIKKGRRPTVMSAPVSVDADWKPPVYEKSDEQAAEIRNDIKDNILFMSVDEDEMKTLVAAFQLKDVAAGTDLIKQGDKVAEEFYAVADGTFEIFVGDKKVMDVAKGGCFGELALLYDAPRAATVKATSDSKVWSLDRVTFKSILCKTSQDKSSLYTGFLDKVESLKVLGMLEKKKLADALVPKEYAAGDVIIKEGDAGDVFFIVHEGEVKCTTAAKGEEEVSDRLKEGAYFGEIALLTQDTRQATVTAVTATKCLTVERKVFDRLLGSLESLKANMPGAKPAA